MGCTVAPDPDLELAAPNAAVRQRVLLADMPMHAWAAVALSVLGVFSIWSTALYLWDLWVTDPLKSIGGFIPLISLALILRTWRSLSWQAEGTWWGLFLFVGTVALVHLRDHAVLELVLSPAWSIFLPPHSLVAFAYVSAVVLLLGGTRLYRAALFPILLVLLVNPVPHLFNRVIDMPLQHASAATARAFAHILGQHLTPDQLYLMFTPDFGMFIAPGCNGIRGSVTMGLIALLAGFLYRFSWRARVLSVAAAVLLGYLFNLVRLCVLVLYYVVALHIHWLQGHAEMADYILGAALFFCATLLLFASIRRFSSTGDLRLPPALPQPVRALRSHSCLQDMKLAVFGFVILAGSATYARAALRSPAQGSGQMPAPEFPAGIGEFHLNRSWPETLVTGQKIFDWGQYIDPEKASAVSIGVSAVLGAHDTLLCHSARGEDWIWHGTLVLPTTAGAISFSASLFNDGAVQYLEASTLCSAAGCGQWTTDRRTFGFVYSRPDPGSLFHGDTRRPVPVLLRAELPDAAVPADIARQKLTAELARFLGSTSLVAFTGLYSSR